MTLRESPLERFVNEVRIWPEGLPLTTKLVESKGCHDILQSVTIGEIPFVTGNPQPAVEELAAEEDSPALGTRVGCFAFLKHGLVILAVCLCVVSRCLEGLEGQSVMPLSPVENGPAFKLELWILRAAVAFGIT